MRKKWNVINDCRNKSEEEIIEAILESRGIEDVFDFMHPTEEDLIPFDKMEGIYEAAGVVLNGINNGSKFYVHFDTDNDGISAGTIATRWLRHMGAEVKVGINQGKAHGISNLDLNELDDIDILWIVDSIESNIEYYTRITNLGVQIVITDHHLIGGKLLAEMHMNPRIHLVSSAVRYPNPELSGSATTWKLCQLMDYIELDDYSDELVDLAASGIVGDMMDLSQNSPENRYICYKGFENLSNPALKKIVGSYDWNAQTVSYGVAPLVNAANRTNNNTVAVDLFLSDNTKETSKLIKELKSFKEEQNDNIDDILPELYGQAEQQINNKVMYFIVGAENIAAGLVANQMMAEFLRPVFVLKPNLEVNEETGELVKYEYTGSFRATGVDDFKAYVENTKIGWSAGHQNAAGVGIPVEEFEEFKTILEESLKDVEFVQETDVDIQISEDQINQNLIKNIKSLNKISGKGFPPVNVMVSNIEDYTVGFLSQGKHLKLVTDSGLNLIKWNFNGDATELVGKLSVVGTLDMSFFGRKMCNQIIISDWRVDKH